MFLLLSTMALALETSCQELMAMSNVGLPGVAIVESVEGSYITDETRKCIAESDLPSEVKAWGLVAEAPPVEQVILIEEDDFSEHEETPEEKAAREVREAEAARDWARQRTQQNGRCESMPDPGTAAVLSLLLGYGAGHFYAEQPERGWRYVAGHAIVNGVMIGGLVIVYAGVADLDPDQVLMGNVVILSAATAVMVLHAADAAMAPESARKTADGCR